MGDGRLRESEAVDHVAGTDRCILGGQQAEDLQPRGITQRPERRHHPAPPRGGGVSSSISITSTPRT